MRALKSLRVACLVDTDVYQQVQRGRPRSSRARDDCSVVQVLRRLCREVTLIPVSHSGADTIRTLVPLRVDVAVNLALSSLAEEALLVGCLQWLGIPFTGSPASALSLAADKPRASHLMRAAGLLTPPFVSFEPGDRIALCELPPFPIIVKPACLGGSLGIYADSIATSPSRVRYLVERIWRMHDVPAICESFIDGRELRVGVVEDSRRRLIPTGALEWHFSSMHGWAFNSSGVKDNVVTSRRRGRTRSMIKLAGMEAERLKTVAARAVRSVGVRGYATLDVRIESDRLFVLEVNPNPALRATSPIWAHPSFERNLERIVRNALLRARC